MKEKIVAIIIMLSIMSSLITVNAVPGHNDIGIAVDDLTYNDTDYIDVKINVTSLNVTNYYVLYPIYNENHITWKKYTAGGSPVRLMVNAYDDEITLSSSVILNVSGMWVLSETGTFDGSYPVDFFWVNSSEVYQISLSKNEVTYSSDESITITVKENGSASACWIDLIREEDGSAVFHRYEPDGKYTFDADIMNYAGNYTVQAYSDLDKYICGYNEGKEYFDNEYGNHSTFSKTNYNYTNCGPYDPPEKTAENKQIIVTSSEPDASLDKDEVKWGFDDTINITLDDFEELLNVKITDVDEEDETFWFDINVTEEYVTISNKASATVTSGGWGRDDCGLSYGENGTWQVCLFLDTDSDGVEEWNTTLDFSVVSADGVQWFWVDDDGVTSTDNKDGSIPEIPDINDQPLEIKFQIIGKDHSFYGEGSSNPVEELGENITVSGNALFTGRLDKIAGVSYANGTWTVRLTPTMTASDRNIEFHVDWEDYGSLTETLNVGGSEKNGTIVKITPTNFVIDEDVTLKVTVFGPLGDEYPLYNADVELYWVNDNGEHTTLINSTTKPDETGKNLYSFNFSTQDQKNGTPPCYIMVYAYAQNVGHGYAKTEMRPKSDLIVNVSKETLMAGMKTEFDIDIYAGNTDTRPDEDDGMTIEFYDEEGELVTLDSSFGSLRDKDVDGVGNYLDDYILIPGIYTIYAYNETHDSTGHNATITVESASITCDKSPFIWNYDKNISATFTVKYKNELLNGTLKIYNMKKMADYYRVWNDTEDKSITFTVTNGKAKIENITADTLPTGKENLTFEFKPSGGGFGEVDDIVEIKVADVSATPKQIAYNQPAKVLITVTGRGNPLDNVNVSLAVPGLTMLESQTNSEGTVQFAFTSLTTGEIKIFIEGRETDEVVDITAWNFDLSAPSHVNEKTQFTVTITNEGEPEGGVSVTFDGTKKTTESNGKVTFTSPEVSTSISYEITASKDGFMSQTKSILVNNVRELEIIMSVDEVTAGDGFTVTIADDEGTAVIGATVTIAGVEYITQAQGIAHLTAPSEARDYKIKASFDDFVDAEETITVNAKPSTPGFEFLAIVVALGAVLLILKRKHN